MRTHVLLFISLLLTTLAGTAQVNTDWYTTNPSANTFTLSTAEELAGLAELVNDDDSPVTFEDKTIILANDIDLSDWLSSTGSGYNGGKGWDPIGKFDGSTFYYNGTFDGNGYAIRGLWIDREDRELNTALFGCVGSDAIIRNLRVTIDTGMGGVTAVDQVSGLVGWNEGQIIGCAVEPVVAGTTEAMVTGRTFACGLVGSNQGDITNCYATGTVTGTSAPGGLVGGNQGDITNCYATGTVTGSSNPGGLVGSNSGDITNCYATGTVTGDEAGGLVGANSGFISNCYATGSVTGDEAGGLVGWHDRGSITASFFDDTVNPTLNVAGSDYGTITNSRGASTIEMQEAGLYTDPTLGAYAWDFTGTADDPAVWAIDAKLNDGYPILRVFYPNAGWYFDRESGQINFTISTAEELAGLAELVNGGYDFDGNTITLANDIDLTPWLRASEGGNPAGSGYNGGKGWDPIGKYDDPTVYYFNGTFDGNGYAIRGLWIDREDRETNTALFGYVGSDAIIRNLRVTIDTGMGGVTAVDQVSGLVGWNEGQIIGCAVEPVVAGTTEAMVTGRTYAGGLVGVNRGSISNCYATGKVTGTSAPGGLVGSNQGDITNCYATGTVTGSGKPGGLVGWNDRGSITASFFDDTVNPSLGVVGSGSGIITNSRGASTDVMQQAGLYTDGTLGDDAWNFTGTGGNPAVWAIDASAANPFNGGYPYLRWQTPTVTLTVSDADLFAYTAAGTTATTLRNTFAVARGNAFPFDITPDEGYTADFATVTATGPEGGTSVLTSAGGDGRYTLAAVVCDTTITVTGIVVKKPDEPVVIYHTLTIEVGEGIVIDKTKTEFQIESGNPFSFVITLAEGYEGQIPTVLVNGHPRRLLVVGTGKWRCILAEIYEDTRVETGFNLTGNTSPDAPRIYSRGGQLIVETPSPGNLAVFTLTGQTVAIRRIAEGTTALPLPQGLYIVCLDQRREKIMIND